MIELESISKSFFGVTVLKHVSFRGTAGQVVALVGENGAGKSTLMNVLGGVLRPDAGTMRLAGEPYRPADAREAAARGVAFIHQELNLFPNLSVAENLHLPDFPRRRFGRLRFPWVDRGRMRQRSAQLLEHVGLRVSADSPVASLSPGQRQLVEIARAIGADARVVIFDEPTTSLTTTEAENLFALISRLRDRGAVVVYITHNLDDVLRLADRVVVLRDGQVVGDAPRDEIAASRMVSLMVGRSIEQLFPPRRPFDPARAEPVLEATGITRRGKLHGVSLTLRRGEVIGLAGLMGAGRTELARALFGLDPIDAGEVRLAGVPLRSLGPRGRIRRGMAFLTEDRRGEGLLMDASVGDNVGLVALTDYARRVSGWVRRRALSERVLEVAQSVQLTGMAANSPQRPVRTLSGGNQQKVVFAKWLLAGPAVFILDEPTRGVDVGAKQGIYQLINELAGRGSGVLMISSELEELIGMCDRILVLARGRLAGSFERSDFDRDAILGAALGTGAGQ
jgi:ABC-type sugar transport system ATPase subunit